MTITKRTIGIILLISGIAFSLSRISYKIGVYYEYENNIGSKWDLADRASTITQKAEYIDEFVLALDQADLYGIHNAILYPTDENYFDQNMKALKSLQQRLKTISNMDENSFSYQTAMQQITEQEQGEAHKMLENIYKCWKKKNYYSCWNKFIVIGFFFIQLILIVLGILFL